MVRVVENIMLVPRVHGCALNAASGRSRSRHIGNLCSKTLLGNPTLEGESEGPACFTDRQDVGEVAAGILDQFVMNGVGANGPSGVHPAGFVGLASVAAGTSCASQGEGRRNVRPMDCSRRGVALS